jgi:hypothetical protein
MKTIALEYQFLGHLDNSELGHRTAQGSVNVVCCVTPLNANSLLAIFFVNTACKFQLEGC